MKTLFFSISLFLVSSSISYSEPGFFSTNSDLQITWKTLERGSITDPHYAHPEFSLSFRICSNSYQEACISLPARTTSPHWRMDYQSTQPESPEVVISISQAYLLNYTRNLTDQIRRKNKDPNVFEDSLGLDPKNYRMEVRFLGPESSLLDKNFVEFDSFLNGKEISLEHSFSGAFSTIEVKSQSQNQSSEILISYTKPLRPTYGSYENPRGTPFRGIILDGLHSSNLILAYSEQRGESAPELTIQSQLTNPAYRDRYRMIFLPFSWTLSNKDAQKQEFSLIRLEREATGSSSEIGEASFFGLSRDRYFSDRSYEVTYLEFASAKLGYKNQFPSGLFWFFKFAGSLQVPQVSSSQTPLKKRLPQNVLDSQPVDSEEMYYSFRRGFVLGVGASDRLEITYTRRAETLAFDHREELEFRTQSSFYKFQRTTHQVDGDLKVKNLSHGSVHITGEYQNDQYRFDPVEGESLDLENYHSGKVGISLHWDTEGHWTKKFGHDSP